jgi:hypothetical protein
VRPLCAELSHQLAFLPRLVELVDVNGDELELGLAVTCVHGIEELVRPAVEVEADRVELEIDPCVVDVRGSLILQHGCRTELAVDSQQNWIP